MGINNGFNSGLLKIKSHVNSLKPSEKKVAEFILTDPLQVIRLSITKLAEMSDVSEATVIKFCQRMGFSGFQELKITLAQEGVEPEGEKGIYGPIQAEDDLDLMMEKIFLIYQQSLADTKKLLKTLPLGEGITMVGQAKRLFFFGYGASGIVARDAELKFKRINFVAEALTDNHLQKTVGSLLTADDLVVAISDSGQTKELIESLEVVRETDAKIIAITSNMGSPLTKLADITLLTSSTETPFRGSAMASRMVQLAVVDLLFLGVATADYQKTTQYLNKTRTALKQNKVNL